MTKAQLAEVVAERLNVTKKLAAKAIDEIFNVITEQLAKGDENTKIGVIPYGSFSKRYRKEREGRDPRTGKKIIIRGRTVAVFTPGKAMKEALDK